MRQLILLLSFGVYSYINGQSYPALEKVLSKELSKDSQKDGRWVFYADKANIKRIDNPSVKANFPNYELFQLTLINYLGYHINQSTCAVLFDSLKSKILLVPPLWYGDINTPLIKLGIGLKYESKDQLLDFFKAVNDIMEIGSDYKFRNTSYTDTLMTYDLGYFKGDSYTTGGNGTSSTTRYNEDGVWRKIKVDIRNLTITRYTFINPAINESKTIE